MDSAGKNFEDMTDRDKFDSLVFAYFDESLDAQQLQQLNSYLREKKHLRRFAEICRQEQAIYEFTSVDMNAMDSFRENENPGLAAPADSLDWHALADYEKIASAVQIPHEKPAMMLIQKVIYPPKEKQKVSRFSLATFIVAAAAMIMMAVLVHFMPVESEEGILSADNNLESAVVVDNVNTCWANKARSLEPGSELSHQDGIQWLQGGIVKLLFKNGAEVIVESPARFEVLSGSQMNLVSGRVYAKVSKRAIGFSIDTPAAHVVDLGTEFGVQVQADKSEIHVIKGKTALHSLGRRTGWVFELPAGNAREINGDGQHRNIALKKNIFVQDISSKMGLVYRDEKAIEIGRWQTQVPAELPDAIQTDGKLVCAVNLGVNAKPVTVSSIAYVPAPEGSVETGDEVTGIEPYAYEGHRPGMAELLNNNMIITDQKSWLGIHLNHLCPGKTYRLQLMMRFDWEWCHINLYGPNGEYRYFPDPDGRNIGIASFVWKSQKSQQVFELTSPSDSSNVVRIFGYVLHEVDESLIVATDDRN